MIPNSNLFPPRSGETALFYCHKCKKNFSAKIPSPGILDIFKSSFGKAKVKCPDCKNLCGLDPKIKY